ncbi:uncharacterized protein EAF02_003662 [Botrytis sinoallii]|uniref:uncharacterized protein n=1 Tax=Botrytis sinoallii TaxID=1463999 RepID=UPI0018FFC5E4|nr:uncharacterized protein EAF02_003662 [Botrytis sinoallii]KAF7887015.1 hypothetical protein EAF02_003662 [Botrytis sinoallii]
MAPKTLQSELEQITCQLAEKHWPGSGITTVRWKIGGYNVTYHVTYDDGFKPLSIALSHLEGGKRGCCIPITPQAYQDSSSTAIGVGKIALAPYIVEEFVEGDLVSGFFMDSRIELRDLHFLLALKSAQSATTLIPCNKNILSSG